MSYSMLVDHAIHEVKIAWEVRQDDAWIARHNATKEAFAVL